MRRRLLYAAMFLSVLASCSHEGITFVEAVDCKAWTNRVELDFRNKDTTSLRSVSLFFRCNSSFLSSIVPLSITYALPDGRIYTEQFDASVVMPEERSRVATVVEVPYRSHSRFGVAGHYMIGIEPRDTVAGVEAVGMKILDE